MPALSGRRERGKSAPALVPHATDQVTTLDTTLRAIAQREASERLALGRLAKVFCVRQAHHDLGFARIGDYARERLGISSSRFYELAQVATSLTSLPLIEAALARGDVSWTKARALAAVAAPDTQEQWLEVAVQRTADELHVLIRSCGARAAGASRPRGSLEPADLALGADPSRDGSPDDEDIDGEPAENVAIRCPQSVKLLWWEALRLSSRVAGYELAAWQSVECIAAEGLSESGWPDEAFTVPWMEHVYGWPRRGRAPAESVASAALEACNPRARAQRDHLARMRARAEAKTAEQLDRSMRETVARIQEIDADLGMLLCRMADARLHRRLGHDDLGSYCRNALGISTRKVRALIAIERARRRKCSRIGAAYRSGALSWHRCLVLLPVLTESTAAVWIERAQQVTARRLADEVMWSRMACDAGLLPTPMPPQLGARLETDFRSFVQIRGSSMSECPSAKTFGSALLDAEIRFRAPASVADMLRAAMFARLRPGEPVWVGLLRLLEHVRGYWSALPRHRDPIFARDGWRCSVPGCSSRRNLHDHHVEFRSQGGGNEHDNRVAVCASHHQHGIHRGVIRATGKAGVGLDWMLGCRQASGPLLRISGRGETYMDEAAMSSDWVRFVPAH
jgi:hypothetical protein